VLDVPKIDLFYIEENLLFQLLYYLGPLFLDRMNFFHSFIMGPCLDWVLFQNWLWNYMDRVILFLTCIKEMA